MTTMTGAHMYDLDLRDEEYFGPPPRFLVEGHPEAEGEDDPEVEIETASKPSALERLKTFLADLRS